MSVRRFLSLTSLAPRYVRLVRAFSVGVALGLTPILPGFRALLRVIPFQMHHVVYQSAFFMGLVAVAVQFYSAEEISRPVLRKRFGFALILMIMGFLLFVILRGWFAESIGRGDDMRGTALYGPSPTKDCIRRCGNPKESPAACIEELGLDRKAIEDCWGDTDLKKRELILEVSYLLFTGGLAGLIGLAFLQWEMRRPTAGPATVTKGATDAPPTKRFRVAFSFAGEKRDYVARVATVLAARFGEAAILYDKFHEAEFARRDLGLYLPDLYHEESDLVVVVVCPDYESKEWCGLEWDAIFDLLKKRRNEEVMLCRFEEATVKGLYSTAGFMDVDDKSAEQTAARILERLALNEGRPKGYYLS